MGKVLFAFILLCCSGPSGADNWSTADTWRESTWQVVNVIDWGQTLDIENCQPSHRCREVNPLLGDNPSRMDINRYFAVGALLHYGISKWLPTKTRKNWQYITIGFGLSTIYSNYRVGVRVSF